MSEIVAQQNEVSLVIFTCEGREHLLKETYASFVKMCDWQFSKTMIVIDGKFDAGIISNIKHDVCLQSGQRQGYVNNIARAIKLIDTPYFFWMEDDFIFNQDVPIRHIHELMVEDKSWAGIFLSRVAPLKEESKVRHYFGDLYLADYGYSVSPTLCNTGILVNAFKALQESYKDTETRRVGFEPFIDKYFIENGFKYAVVDPGEIPHVTHIGDMESTAREYHMINSLDPGASDIDKFYLSGFGKEGQITAYNKIAMLLKMWYAVLVLSIKMFRSRQSYDFAFRIYLAFLRGFKY